MGELERILDMCTGRPVNVDNTRRCVNDLWPVNLRNSGRGVDIVDSVGLNLRKGCRVPGLFLLMKIEEILPYG